MSVRFAEIGPWTVAVECDLAAVHKGLALNFGRRYSSGFPDASGVLLTCRVVTDSRACARVYSSIALTGPEVPLSPGISIRYSFSPPKTWFGVTSTALIELDSTKPAESTVWLAPEAILAYRGAMEPDPEKRTPCPEAFFYPLLAEWLRSFGACLVHCGAAALNGRALFLTGTSGSGKSTHVLRMVARGASFVADDLALLSQTPQGVRLSRFREVANVVPEALKQFPELAHLCGAPVRGDGKHSVSIPEYFPGASVPNAEPGVVLRLHSGERPSFEPVPPGNVLDGLHSMAWFGSRPEFNQAHFQLLTDWLFQCLQFYVSRAYVRDHLDELMSRVAEARAETAL
jgi:hypothetical protein